MMIDNRDRQIAELLRRIESLEKALSKQPSIEIGTGGGGAPTDAQYYVAAANGSLSAEVVMIPDDSTVEIAAGTLQVKDGGIPATKLADGAALAEILDDDGAGSGLDADLLDGSHASAFAAASHNHAAGDITSGQLALARGGTAADLSATGGSGQYVKQASLGGALTVGAQALDDAKVSKLRESDDSADAVTVDADGDVFFETGRAFLLDSATRAPLNIVARSSAPSTPSTDDIYLDDGTNTGSGDPAYFWYNGSSWVEISPAPVAATETVAGKAEIATSAEVAGGVDDQRIVTPLKLTGLPVDHFRVSELRQSDDGGTALSADAAGDLTTAGDLTVAGVLALAAGANVSDIDISMAASPTDAQLLTAQGIKEYIDSLLPAIASWTPQVYQNGNISSTADNAIVIWIRGLVILVVDVTVTGSGTSGNAIEIQNLPYPINHTAGRVAMGSYIIVDAGSSTYKGVVDNFGSDQIRFLYGNNDAATFIGSGGGAADFALANTDTISFIAIYEDGT